MTTTQLLALWGCFVYFALVFMSFIGRAMWGTLGFFRPSDPDAESDVIAKDVIFPILQSFADDLATLTYLVGLGGLLLFTVTTWISVTRWRTWRRVPRPSGRAS